MQITSITPTDENGKREIYIDGELFATLGADIVMSLDLHSGDELDEAQTEQLLHRVESMRAVQKAYTYLSYNALSRKALFDKLRKAEFSETAIEMALERLEGIGLIDDEALAQRLKGVMLHSKHWGARRAADELYKRGLSRQTITAVLSDYEDGEALYWQLQHKFAKAALSDPKERRRVMNALVRLGFRYDDIRSAMNEEAE